jgi:acetyl-CoA synthetase
VVDDDGAWFLLGRSDDVLSVAGKRVGPAFPGTRVDRELRKLVTNELGRPYVPARIAFVPALPRTRSGKIVRRAIRACVAGDDAGDLSALENPEALQEIRAAGAEGRDPLRTNE